ncbi:MAG: hypothetical protein NWP61_02525, partial [Rickettsiaceae bacterium]|nr:hypothetical protein [Rickettsiaceae bacterium]
MLFHYLFKQKGGWIKLTEKSSETNLSNDGFLSSFRDFNIIKLFKNSTPKNDISYTFLGLFFVVSVFSTMYSIPLNIRNEYTELLSFIYHSVLTVSAAFLTYAIWPSSFKNKSFGAVFWFLGLFYVLVFIGCLQVIISNFGQFQLMIFLLGIVVLSAVVRWQVAMFLIITGVILSIRYFKWHVGIDAIQGELGGLQFKIMYLLLMVTSILVVFLKPKQEEYEATEQKARDSKIEAEYAKRELQNILQGFDYLEKQLKQKEGRLEEKEKHLRDQLKHRNKEIHKLTDIKDEFLRNIEHEFNTPLTGILSLCDVVYSCYDDLNESMIKSSMKDIV